MLVLGCLWQYSNTSHNLTDPIVVFGIWKLIANEAETVEIAIVLRTKATSVFRPKSGVEADILHSRKRPRNLNLGSGQDIAVSPLNRRA
jgi:hypothetical protein